MNYSGPVVCVLRQERSCSLLMCAVHAHELVKSRKMFRLSTGNMKMIQQENFIQLVIASMNAEGSFWHFWNWNTYTIQPCSIGRKMVVKCWSSIILYFKHLVLRANYSVCVNGSFLSILLKLFGTDRV
jgi:hypothetical protein